MMIFSEQYIKAIAKQYFQLEAAVTALTGEYEFNFLLTAPDGTKYILKVAGDEHSYAFLMPK